MPSPAHEWMVALLTDDPRRLDVLLRVLRRMGLRAHFVVVDAAVHLVDAGVDTGPIIAQRTVPVEPGDDEASLHERIKEVEWQLLPEVVNRLVTGGCRVDGRRVEL